MPIVSMFYGIVVKLNTKEYNPPQVHASCAGQETSFDFNGKVLVVGLPNNKEILIKAWIEIHRDGLLLNWELAQSHEKIRKIDPLK